MSTRSRQTRALGPLAALALALAACASTPAAASPPQMTPAPSNPPASVAPSAAPSPSAVRAIPDGKYLSDAVDVSHIIARINADMKLTAAQRAHAISGFSGHKTQRISLDLHGGTFTEFEAFDGAPFEVGARATYAFPDGHTLVIQEQCCGVTTFDVTPAQHGFSLRYRTYIAKDEEDALIGKIVYESSPFTSVP
jgi:hypothetical protein